jgi:hypothetical protein
VIDLGQQNLKDVQHERIYQLALEGGPAEFPPLKAEAPKSSSDLLGERIERHVEEMIEKSFAGGLNLNPEEMDMTPSHATRWTMVGLLNLVLLVAAIAAIVFLVKLLL